SSKSARAANNRPVGFDSHAVPWLPGVAPSPGRDCTTCAVSFVAARRVCRQEVFIRITALSPLPGRPGRVAVCVDRGTRCTAAIEAAAAAGLRVGDAVEGRALARLERAVLAWRVRQAAFDLLAYRPRSVEELRRRLLRKSFPEGAVDAGRADLRA